MKFLIRLGFLLAATLWLALAAPSRPLAAQPVGRAAAEFPNLKPNRQETPWGRLVADALQSAGKADCALINAGALRAGTLEAGSVESDDIAALLSFGDDEAVTLSLSGAQLRAALERGASTYPTGSPAFLHVAGLSASFDTSAPSGQRISGVRVAGRPLDDKATYSVAMPVSLSEGAAGYFNIWNGAKARPAGQNLLSAVGGYFKNRGEVSPDNAARFGPR